MKNKPTQELNQFDEYFDLEVLTNVISHDKFDGKIFEGVFDLVWSCLKELQAPRHDASWKQWKTETTQEISGRSWASVIPLILNRFLCKLDEIEREVKQFQDTFDFCGTIE